MEAGAGPGQPLTERPPNGAMPASPAGAPSGKPATPAPAAASPANVGVWGALGQAQPSAREIAAAADARRRLGYAAEGEAEGADGGAEAAPPPPPKLPTGVLREAEVEYVATEELRPVAAGELDAALAALPVSLDSERADWLATCAALNSLRALAVHHASALAPLLPPLLPLLLKSLRTPRSGLCKTALMAAADLAAAYPSPEGPFLPALDAGPRPSLLCQLLTVARADKKFVAEAAEAALAALVAKLPAAGLLPLLASNVSHPNYKVRAKAGAALAASAARLLAAAGPAAVRAAAAPAVLLRAAGALVVDKQPEARDAARGLIAVLREACVGMEADASAAPAAPAAPAAGEEGAEAGAAGPAPRDFEGLCAAVLDATTAAAVLKSGSSGGGRK